MAKKKEPKPIPSVRELPCKLTEEERRARTDELLDCEDKLEAFVEERKSAVAAIKARSADVSARVKVLRGTLRSGDEVRTVPCTTTPDHDLGKMVTTRDDTGAVIESRPMTEHEKQGKLFEPEAERAPAKLIPIRGGKTDDADPVSSAVAQAAGHLADAPPFTQAPVSTDAPPPAGTEAPPEAKPEPKKTSRRRRAESIITEGS